RLQSALGPQRTSACALRIPASGDKAQTTAILLMPLSKPKVILAYWLRMRKWSAADKHAWRDWKRRVREVLNHDWDPIGGCPEDEYDPYAGKVAAMIRAGASDGQLGRYLNWAEVYLGQRFDPYRAAIVITALRNLGPAPQQVPDHQASRKKAMNLAHHWV